MPPRTTPPMLAPLPRPSGPPDRERSKSSTSHWANDCASPTNRSAPARGSLPGPAVRAVAGALVAPPLSAARTSGSLAESRAASSRSAVNEMTLAVISQLRPRELPLGPVDGVEKAERERDGALGGACRFDGN